MRRNLSDKHLGARAGETESVVFRNPVAFVAEFFGEPRELDALEQRVTRGFAEPNRSLVRDAEMELRGHQGFASGRTSLARKVMALRKSSGVRSIGENTS